MYANTSDPRPFQATHKPDSPGFRDWLCFTTIQEGLCIPNLVTEAMEWRGYGEKEIFGVRLALEEALVNAVKHGNRHDPAKCVWASWHVGPNRVLIEIEDEGDGFNPRAVPDPCAAENLERSCGRGLFLMRHYMTSVRYNRRGNRVTMCKRRGASQTLSN
jgi:serine/threonine-protein kinase RsbW